MFCFVFFISGVVCILRDNRQKILKAPLVAFRIFAPCIQCVLCPTCGKTFLNSPFLFILAGKFVPVCAHSDRPLRPLSLPPFFPDAPLLRHGACQCLIKTILRSEYKSHPLPLSLPTRMRALRGGLVSRGMH